MMPTKRMKKLTKKPYEPADIKGDEWELGD